MRWRRLLSATLAPVMLSSTLALGACYERGRVYVQVGPPAPIVEVRAVSPGPGYVWIEGYHRWSGNRYEWVAGRWERPPHARSVWVAGHWDHDGHGYFWTEGRWRG